MGNDVSSQDEKKKLVNETDVNLIFKDHNSSYKGLKTPNGTDKDEIKSVSGSQTTDKTNEQKDINVPTIFEWKEGGKIVYLTGSFSNWTQKFLMPANANGNFMLSLDLPKGIHQYKFIVDNVWRFSKHYPTINDGRGNINNIIDSTDYVKNIPEVEKNHAERKKSKENSKQKEKKSEEYSGYIPKKSEMNTDAPQIPHQYSKRFNPDLNTNQFFIGNGGYISYYERNLLSENNSFKQISIPPHVNLNHLGTKCLNSKASSILSAFESHRIRNKYLTIIYYKPLNAMRD